MLALQKNATYDRLQLGNLIAGLAELLQDFVKLVLHAVAVQLLVLKVFDGELDLRGGKDGKPR